MSALREPDALTLAQAAAIMRGATKDKSFLDLPLGREIRRYLAAKRKELTPSSYNSYEGTLHKLAVEFADLSLADFEIPRGPDILEPWMDSRWGESAPGTYNVCHAHLKDFFRWQVRRDRMISNPMERVGRARKVQTLRETFSQDEVRAMIASAPLLRDRIALRLLFHHGLRKGALQTIQFKHFSYERRVLTVFTKGSKVQAIDLPEPAFWTDLERHLLEAAAEPNHYLMCVIKQMPYGTPDALGRRPTRAHWMPGRMMTSTPLHNWWGDRIKDAGVPYRHMHCARHTFAQMILENTGDITLAQELLGHVSIGTTQMYAAYTHRQRSERLAAVLRETVA